MIQAIQLNPLYATGKRIQAPQQPSVVSSRGPDFGLSTRREWLRQMGTLGVLGSLGFLSTPALLQAQQPVASRVINTTGVITDRERRYYQQFMDFFKHLEGIQDNPQHKANEEARLRQSWDTLKTSVKAGDKADRKVLDAIWAELMVQEITQPSWHAVRFDYAKFNDLRNDWSRGQLNQDGFNKAVQVRALKGLLCYYYESGFTNELVPDPQRLYEPVSKLMDGTNDVDMIRYGNALLLQCFPKFKPEHQAKLVTQQWKDFWDEPDGAKKATTLRNLWFMQADAPRLETWAEQKTAVEKHLKRWADDEKPPETNVKYAIVMASLMNYGQLAEKLTPLLKVTLSDPQSSFGAAPVIQEAVAWALGRDSSTAAVDHLVQLVEHLKVDEKAREYAMFSLDALGRDGKTDAVKQRAKAALMQWTLALSTARAAEPSSEASKPPAWMTPDAQDALGRVWEKWQDKLNEQDYFINQWLPAKADQEAYRKSRDSYVSGHTTLSVARQNMVDRALLPYRHHLDGIVGRGGKHKVITGAITEDANYQHLLAVRDHDGRIYDTIKGIASNQLGVLTNQDRITPGGYNTFAHEFIHHLEETVLNPTLGLSNTIQGLYQTAVRESRVMNYYSTYNKHEYLAECGEALERPYSPHYYLFYGLFNNGYDSGLDSIRSKLKRLDPKAYALLDGVRRAPSVSVPKNTERIRSVFTRGPIREKFMASADPRLGDRALPRRYELSAELLQPGLTSADRMIARRTNPFADRQGCLMA